MFDVTGLMSLFPALFQASKEWTEPKAAKVDPLDAIEGEPSVKALKAKGHDLGWIREGELRDRARKGWTPVIDRDVIGRPTIFTDRLGELVLVHRLPPAA